MTTQWYTQTFAAPEALIFNRAKAGGGVISPMSLLSSTEQEPVFMSKLQANRPIIDMHSNGYVAVRSVESYPDDEGADKVNVV